MGHKMSKWNLEEDLSADYLCPDLYKMHQLRLEHKKAQSSRYALWVAVGSFLIATISLIVAIVK